jgi:hypothetical protein
LNEACKNRPLAKNFWVNSNPLPVSMYHINLAEKMAV